MRKMKFLVTLLPMVFTLILLSSFPSMAMAQSQPQPIKYSVNESNITYSLMLSPGAPLTMTVESQPPIIQADSINGPKLNGADPNYVPTEAELKLLAKKEARVKQFMLQALNATQPEAVNTLHTLSVGTSGQWREPNDYAHRNYCGPGATQVALDARLPASSVPDINTIGNDEHIDPANGVTTQAIGDELNRLLGDGYYGVSGAANQADFEWRVRVDIDDGYSLVTALKTGGMPGWGTRNVKHIVATYGYATGSPITVYYVETAAPAAGYNGNYFNNQSAAQFWPWVSSNNSQVW